MAPIQTETAAGPKVSVILPVYNMAQTLPATLESVLSRTIGSLEVLCVDDGSTDDTSSVLRRYSQKDPRVFTFTQPNAGPGPARNLALEHARGEFVAFMDADDQYPDAHTLETLYRAAAEHGAAIAGGSRLIRRDTGVTLSPEQHFEREGFVDYRDFQRGYDYQCYLFSHETVSSCKSWLCDIPAVIFHASACDPDITQSVYGLNQGRFARSALTYYAQYLTGIHGKVYLRYCIRA